MNARRLTFVGCLMVAGALLIPWRTESPLPGSTAVAAPSRPDERVRIEHDLVRIPVTTAKPPVKSVRLAQPAPRPAGIRYSRVDSQPLRASNNTARPEGGLIGKTMKRIAGDGRYRPEPFPRVK